MEIIHSALLVNGLKQIWISFLYIFYILLIYYLRNVENKAWIEKVEKWLHDGHYGRSTTSINIYVCDLLSFQTNHLSSTH